MYLILTAVHSLTLMSTFGFLPKQFIPHPESNNLVRTNQSADESTKAKEANKQSMYLIRSLLMVTFIVKVWIQIV